MHGVLCKAKSNPRKKRWSVVYAEFFLARGLKSLIIFLRSSFEIFIRMHWNINKRATKTTAFRFLSQHRNFLITIVRGNRKFFGPKLVIIDLIIGKINEIKMRLFPRSTAFRRRRITNIQHRSKGQQGFRSS